VCTFICCSSSSFLKAEHWFLSSNYRPSRDKSLLFIGGGGCLQVAPKPVSSRTEPPPFRCSRTTQLCFVCYHVRNLCQLGLFALSYVFALRFVFCLLYHPRVKVDTRLVRIVLKLLLFVEVCAVALHLRFRLQLRFKVPDSAEEIRGFVIRMRRSSSGGILQPLVVVLWQPCYDKSNIVVFDVALHPCFL